MYAISAAGVVHAITRACSKGQLQHCACDPGKRGKGQDKRGSFDWGGCSDNVGFGSRFSRMFIDAKERKTRDARALMNLHNNRAGRRVSAAYLECLNKYFVPIGSLAISGLVVITSAIAIHLLSEILSSFLLRHQQFAMSGSVVTSSAEKICILAYTTKLRNI